MNISYYKLLEIARRQATLDNDRYDYCPKNIQEAAEWHPHDWVLRAMAEVDGGEVTYDDALTS